MSKKQEKSPKKGGKEGSFPTCINKKEARMVCLSEECEEHPFFCSDCDDSSCEIAHQHSDKLVSVSFKEFTKRVLRDRKPIEPLNEAITSYREVLQKLKEDVSQFIEKEMASLDEIVHKAEEINSADVDLMEKLRLQQYDALTGRQMDELWVSCAQDPSVLQGQKEASEFIKIKEEEVRGISEHFEHLNQMEIDNIEDDDQDEDEGKKKPKKGKPAPAKKK